MIPRGEVGLIFATLGLNQHVFGQDVYAALLLVVLLTTVGTPPVLRWRLLKIARGATHHADRRLERRHHARSHRQRAGRARSRAAPERRAHCRAPRRAPVCGASGEPVAARVARSVSARVRAAGTTPRATSSSRCCATPNRARGACSLHRECLQRCLPELDDVLVHRRPSALDLDPLATLRLSRLARVRELLALEDDPPYANFGAPRRARARRLRRRFRAGRRRRAAYRPAARSRRSGRAVGRRARERRTTSCRAAAHRSEALSEESVLQIAVHLDSIQQADALYLLSRAGEITAVPNPTSSGHCTSSCWPRSRIPNWSDGKPATRWSSAGPRPPGSSPPSR